MPTPTQTPRTPRTPPLQRACRPALPRSFEIDRRKYHPSPKVNGAVVRFALTPPSQRLAVPSEPDFLKLVSRGESCVGLELGTRS